MRLTMRTLMGFVEDNGSSRDKRRMWLLDPLVDELVEEIAEMDEAKIQYFWENIAHVFKWMATGDTEGIPPDVLSFIHKIDGVPVVPEQDALFTEDGLVPVKVIEGEVIAH